MSLFVDSSAWYAAADESDASNERARAILAAREALVTTDHVLVETWFLLRHRLGRRAAERFLSAIVSGVARVEVTTGADLEQAIAIGKSFPDQDFSLVDRTSFSVMLRLGIHRAASFDNHFAVFRFGRGRRQAFEVVR